MRTISTVSYSILCIAAAGSFSTRLSAQHDDRLEEVIITARPDSAQGIDHIAQPVSVLQGDRLFEKMAGTLGETLAREPGVSASDFGQGASRPVIRGMAGPRVRILQNGLGSMDVSTISVDHAVTLEPMSAEQIEVLRGPATLIFGSGASGGIVNISNNRIHENATEPFSASINAGFLSAAEPGYAGFNVDA
jgi:iron complex outermembrane receptor protein